MKVHSEQTEVSEMAETEVGEGESREDEEGVVSETSGSPPVRPRQGSRSSI